tara:strand:- start:57 stop:191 length:135 start_codon:yes stop_codon:yes gene_type:complete
VDKKLEALENLHDDYRKHYKEKYTENDEEDEFIILHTRGGSAES